MAEPGAATLACAMALTLRYIWAYKPTPEQCQVFVESQRHLFPLGMVLCHIRHDGCLWFHDGWPPIMLSPVNALRLLCTYKECAGFVINESGLLAISVQPAET